MCHAEDSGESINNHRQKLFKTAISVNVSNPFWTVFVGFWWSKGLLVRFSWSAIENHYLRENNHFVPLNVRILILWGASRHMIRRWSLPIYGNCLVSPRCVPSPFTPMAYRDRRSWHRVTIRALACPHTTKLYSDQRNEMNCYGESNNNDDGRKKDTKTEKTRVWVCIQL